MVPLEKLNGDSEAGLVSGRLSSAESIAKPTVKSRFRFFFERCGRKLIKVNKGKAGVSGKDKKGIRRAG